VVGAAVERADGDHVPLALRRGGQQAGGRRGHAGGEGHRLLAVFELCQRLLEAPDGRVPQPLVDVRAARHRQAAGGHRLVAGAAEVHVRQRVGGGQVDRRYVHAEAREIGASRVHGAGVQVG
jgi:hypothetical protein